MQISGELIHGVRMAANMAQNLMSDGNRLLENQNGKQQAQQEKALKAAVADAIAREQKRNLSAVVMALIEAGVPYEGMVDLLRKYWDLPDAKAREYAVRGQTVDYPCRQLCIYLQSQGWTEEEISLYLKDNNVKKKLRLNHELWKLSPELLIEEVEE